METGKIAFLVLLSVMVAFATEDQHHTDNPDTKTCLKEAGVTWADVRNYRSGTDDTPDEKMLCFMKCRMEKNGLIKKEDGTIDLGKVDNKLIDGTPDELKSISECMEKVPPVKECKQVEELQKCFTGVMMKKH